MEKRKYLFLIALSCVYFAGTAARAAGRPFWYDEIITLIAANTPDLATTWKAAAATDASPPLPHLLTHLSIRWFGLNELSGRLPAILGFWTLCLCLFQFVQRRAGALYGFCALALPVLTNAYFYSTEARAYGLELGFVGIALIAWQAAAAGRNRAVALPALCLSLVSMLLCQYYAIFAYLPLAGGELARTRRARKIDFPIWIAFALGTAPLAWRMVAILGAIKVFSHTWAPAYLRQGIEFWEFALAPLGPYLALLVGALALLKWRTTPADESATTEHATPEHATPEHEWIAGALFVAIPLAAVMAGLLVTHMFTERYALIGTIGFCFLTPLLAARLFGRGSTAGCVLLAVMLLGMAIRLADSGAKGNPYASEPMLQAALEQGPVVVADGQLFLQTWQYAPERLKSRIVFPADMPSALKYSGFDTLDYGLATLLPWTKSLSVPDYAAFAKPGKEFMLYQNSLRPGWLLARVMADGAKVEVQQAASYRQLLKVRLRD